MKQKKQKRHSSGRSATKNSGRRSVATSSWGVSTATPAKVRAGKTRKNKRELARMLELYFRDNAGREILFKKLSRDLRLNTHPLKMLALDILDEMVMGEYLVRTTDGAFLLNENDRAMRTILSQHELAYSYPREVEEAAARITGEITPHDLSEREDFRSVFTCTIAPFDAKDIDEALSIRKLAGDLYEVGVHIADVSHYVKEGSIIDKEAQRRATSVYLVDRTIPMLPEHLCNFVCSLRPNEDKLAYSVIFDINARAEILKYRIVHTVIRSDRRFTYEEVQQLLTDCKAVPEQGPFRATSATAPTSTTAQLLCTLWSIAKQLREKRFANGAIQFESEEMKFELDEHNRPIRCYFKKLYEANNLVEEFMLLANRTVAESVGRVAKGKVAKTLPYRVHDNPDPEKLANLKEFIARFGYKMKATSTRSEAAREMNRLISSCEGTREQRLIQTVALRSMMKAQYSVHNIGHFGLVFDYYTHFTSPIRRYPDTMVHRLLTHYQRGGKSANKDYYEELCQHSSAMELQAAMAERESVKYKAVEFMMDKVGQVYDAHISGITDFGLFCEIDENHCEGMVALRTLKEDYYDYDEKEYCLRGRKFGFIYRLGDPVRVEVVKANLDKRQLDFEVV